MALPRKDALGQAEWRKALRQPESVCHSSPGPQPTHHAELPGRTSSSEWEHCVSTREIYF